MDTLGYASTFVVKLVLSYLNFSCSVYFFLSLLRLLFVQQVVNNLENVRYCGADIKLRTLTYVHKSGFSEFSLFSIYLMVLLF